MEADALAPVVVEANTLPNHETQVAMVVPAAAAAAAAVAVAWLVIAARKQS